MDMNRFISKIRKIEAEEIIKKKDEYRSSPRQKRFYYGTKGSIKWVLNMGKKPKKGEKIFNSSRQSIDTLFLRQRRRIVYKLNNPKLLKISFHTFRHWKATMEYHKTKDIIHVQQRLGHKDIRNTMIYITIEQTIFQSGPDQYISKVANTVEEARQLIEVGFEYIGNILGAEIFRKRK